MKTKKIERIDIHIYMCFRDALFTFYEFERKKSASSWGFAIALSKTLSRNSAVRRETTSPTICPAIVYVIIIRRDIVSLFCYTWSRILDAPKRCVHGIPATLMNRKHIDFKLLTSRYYAHDILFFSFLEITLYNICNVNIILQRIFLDSIIKIIALFNICIIVPSPKCPDIFLAILYLELRMLFAVFLEEVLKMFCTISEYIMI